MRRISLFTTLLVILFVFDACKKDDDIAVIEEVDSDGDGFLDHEDNCPDFYSIYQFDSDGDGIGDLCDNDYSPRFGGSIPETEEELANVELAIYPVIQNLPSEFFYNYPPNAQQGVSPSSVAFATTYYLKFNHETFDNNLSISWYADDNFEDVDLDNAFSPAYVFNQIKIGECSTDDIIAGNCGAKLVDALEILKTQGVCKWGTMPYVAGEHTEMPNEAQMEEASQFKIMDYMKVDHTNIEHIKTIFFHRIPIVFTIAIDEKFKQLRDSEIWEGQGYKYDYQSLIISGYDDEKQAFRAKNSWGSDWGNNSYTGGGESGDAWISYEAFQLYTHSAFITFDDLSPDHIEELGFYYGDWDGDGKSNIAIANSSGTLRLDSNFDNKLEGSIDFPWGYTDYLVGDWDKDGIDEFAMRNYTTVIMDFYGDESSWFTLEFDGEYYDEYIVGDWDGDNDDDIGIKRGNEFLLNTNATSDFEINFIHGEEDDKVIVGDFNGDGVDNIALLRDKTIMIDFEYDGIIDIEYDFGLGNEADQYFSKDWNGDGIDDIGYRKSYYMRVDTNFDGITDNVYSCKFNP